MSKQTQKIDCLMAWRKDIKIQLRKRAEVEETNDSILQLIENVKKTGRLKK